MRCRKCTQRERDEKRCSYVESGETGSLDAGRIHPWQLLGAQEGAISRHWRASGCCE